MGQREEAENPVKDFGLFFYVAILYREVFFCAESRYLE